MYFYDPEVDGTIEEYIEQCKIDRINAPTFLGYDHYHQLCKQGFIVPNISSIRLMYAQIGPRPDEFYCVVDGYMLDGADLMKHSGKEGIHDPLELLNSDAPPFEASGLNPRPGELPGLDYLVGSD